MIKNRPGPGLLLLLLLSLILPAQLLAAVEARLDRYQVYEGDQLTLFIESDNPQAGEPDLKVLARNFRILGKNASSQVTIINGKRSDKISWRIGLEPLRLGQLEVPSLTVGNDKTRPLQVTVSEVPEQVAAQQAQQLFIETEIDKRDKNYVQQQINLRVRLYHDGSLIGGEISEPEVENTVIERLGDDARYTTTRNGRRYQVIERRYVILPERSGELRIPPVTLKGELAAPKQDAPGGSPIDNFFRNSPFGNDPFFRNTPFRSPGKPVRTRSKPIVVEILPRPANATGNWLPTEKLTLKDSWTSQPPQLRAGEPVSRTITIEAIGLTGSQLPDIETGQPQNTRVYPDQPAIQSRTDGNKVFGFSRQTFSYIPNRSGKLTIPPIELDWWNTGEDKPETARLPKWELTVMPGAGGTQQEQGAPEPGSTDQPVHQENSDDRSVVADDAVTDGISRNWWWILLLILVPLIWWFFSRRGKKPAQSVMTEEPVTSPPQSKTTPADFQAALKKLQEVIAGGNARDTATALLETATARWPDDPPGNLGALAGRLGEDARDAILELDRALYAPGAQAWDGHAFREQIKDAWDKSEARDQQTKTLLEPLYPER